MIAQYDKVPGSTMQKKANGFTLPKSLGGGSQAVPVSVTVNTDVNVKPLKVQPELSQVGNVESKASDSAGVVVRTMQDDLAELNATPVVSSALKSNVPTKGTLSSKISPLVSGTPIAPKPRMFPLPPVGASQKQKVVIPPRKKKHRSARSVILFAFVLALVAVVGGAAWWLWSGMIPGMDNFGGEKPVPALEVIPANVSAVVQYKIGSTDDRTAIATMLGKRTDAPSISSLLRGDPRLILDMPDVNEFYYVLLPSETRPFLLMPKTATVDQMLKGKTDANLESVGGWYVAHSISVTPYKESLTEKAAAQLGDQGIFSTALVSEAPVRVILGGSLISQLRTELLGRGFEAGKVNAAGFSGRFLPGYETVEIAGTVALAESVDGVGANANQHLLSLVSSKATFTHLGGNFQADLTSWVHNSAPVDASALDKPNVQSLLAQLTTPYVVFVSDSQQAERSFSLAIELPSSLRAKIGVGDAAVEEGLMSLVPLITGRKTVAPVAFSSGLFGSTSLRYANLDGSSKALDYAITDAHILIATSKDAMVDLLKLYQGEGSSVLAAGPFQKLFSAWGALPTARSIVLGAVSLPGVKDILPAFNGKDVVFGVAFQPGDTGKALQVHGFVEGVD